MGYGLLKVVGTIPQVITMGVIDLRKYGDHYLKLRRIFERVIGIIEAYLPDELAIEAPFFGKNVQSMLKLGRAQGVAMAGTFGPGISITNFILCAVEDKNGDNRQWTSQQGAGSRHVEENVAHTRKRDVAFYGCDRWTGSSLLSLFTNGQTHIG